VLACGVEEGTALGALEELLSAGQVQLLAAPESAVPAAQAVAGNRHIVSASGWLQLSERLRLVLAEYHRQYPMRLGMPREELKSRLQPRLPWVGRLYNELLERAAAEEIVAEGDGIVRAADHAVRFTAEQQKRIDDLLSRFHAEPYAPPSWAEASSSVGADVLQALVEAKTLTRVSEDVLFRTETYEEIVQSVLAHLHSEGSITVAQVRDLFGTSRKYALPLMEHLDERRVTRRVGDRRVLR
jgi:selenocysteine-specific elongation factor